ncbi:hypothetical protein CDD83_6536 [Cordyceps sp. RAO-2017]|nr:hypothetical protein CDD83_6536 [Cordyceps sp. RAO-2017]
MTVLRLPAPPPPLLLGHLRAEGRDAKGRQAQLRLERTIRTRSTHRHLCPSLYEWGKAGGATDPICGAAAESAIGKPSTAHRPSVRCCQGAATTTDGRAPFDRVLAPVRLTSAGHHGPGADSRLGNRLARSPTFLTRSPAPYGRLLACRTLTAAFFFFFFFFLFSFFFSLLGFARGCSRSVREGCPIRDKLLSCYRAAGGGAAPDFSSYALLVPGWSLAELHGQFGARLCAALSRSRGHDLTWAVGP